MKLRFDLIICLYDIIIADFCKKISEKEADDSSDSDEKPFNSEDETDTPFIHHPFKLRDPNPNIVMNIRVSIFKMIWQSMSGS